MGLLVGWLLLSLAGSFVPVLAGRAFVMRALPENERMDLLLAGGGSRWSQPWLSTLAGPMGAFVRRVLAEPLESDRVDLVCERLAEVDVETAHVKERLAMLARCALAVSGAIFVVMTSGAVREESAWLLAWGIIPLVLGGTAAFSCGWMGRWARGGIAERRLAWDRLARWVLQSPTSTESRSATDDSRPTIHRTTALDRGSTEDSRGTGHRCDCSGASEVARINLAVG